MLQSDITGKRRVIPRWRRFSSTPTSELVSARSAAPYLDTDEIPLLRALERWNSERTVGRAIEVVNQALISETPAKGLAAAHYILAEGATPTDAVRITADRLVHGQKNVEIGNFAIDVMNDGERFGFVQKEIGRLKSRLRLYPNNALEWLEVARLQCTIGQPKSARKAIRNALIYAPENRLVLRATARFMMHDDDPAQALWALRKSEAVRYDPWIQAAEIAVSSVMGKRSKILKVGKNLLQRTSLSAHQTSELASALATEELLSGDTRGANRHFKMSLVSPTDNSVAQAVWAENMGIQHLKPNPNSVANAFEGRMQKSIQDEEFEEAFLQSVYWLSDESYSVMPARMGSYIADSHLKNYNKAIEVADVGLIANPHDLSLKNNKTVSLAHLGLLDEAVITFEPIAKLVKSTQSGIDPTYLATAGLLEFRRGNSQQGRDLYEGAVIESRKLGHIAKAFRAKIHWLLEEMHVKEISADAINKVMKRMDDDVKYLKEIEGDDAKSFWSSTKLEIEKNIQHIIASRKTENEDAIIGRALTSAANDEV